MAKRFWRSFEVDLQMYPYGDPSQESVTRQGTQVAVSCDYLTSEGSSKTQNVSYLHLFKEETRFLWNRDWLYTTQWKHPLSKFKRRPSLIPQWGNFILEMLFCYVNNCHLLYSSLLAKQHDWKREWKKWREMINAASVCCGIHFWLSRCTWWRPSVCLLLWKCLSSVAWSSLHDISTVSSMWSRHQYKTQRHDMQRDIMNTEDRPSIETQS